MIYRKISLIFFLTFSFFLTTNSLTAADTDPKKKGQSSETQNTATPLKKRTFEDFNEKLDDDAGTSDDADTPDDAAENIAKKPKISHVIHEDEEANLPDDRDDDEEDLFDFLDDEVRTSLSGDDDLPETPAIPLSPRPGSVPLLAARNLLVREPTPFEKKITEIQFFPEVAKVVNELISDQMRGGSSSTTGQMQRKKLDTLLALPWLAKDQNNIDLTAAKATLDQEHFGLDKVKDRVIEHLAVQIRKKDNLGTILCLVGPPGVGKTTLAESIAKAVGRKFVKVAFGGVHDESAIRGYPPSYQSAQSGKIINAMIKAEVVNPLILLDEIDKLAEGNHNGSPAAALLEVLDPSQNKKFEDHFIGVPYDLSNVMFIASANSLDMIPEPLIDRMEIIELSSYTALEKFEIARRHLMPKILLENGVEEGELSVTDAAVKRLISDYTCEAGVRQLARIIGKLSRKVVTLNLMNEPQDFMIEPETLVDFLDHSHARNEKPLDFHMVGHTQGLSVSRSGGHMLPVEVKIVPGKGNIIRTGKMGDVMKESAEAAMTVVRDRVGHYGIRDKQIKRKDFHVHFYAAAIPKDGPSAGLAMATTIMSAITGRPVNRLVCMTGEISLHGKALPIGGLKEKLIAAHRAGMETAIIPEANIKNLVDVPDEVRQELEIIAVSDISEVLDIALIPSEDVVDV